MWTLLVPAVLVGALLIEEGRRVSTIAFGSCYGLYGSEDPTVFRSIHSYKPDLFLWLGDAIYADATLIPNVFAPAADYSAWAKKYSALKAEPHYSLLSNYTMISGTWDDHDFGLNNAGKDFAHKRTAQRTFLDFLDEPNESVRRAREGVYTSYNFEALKVILLDNRYFRDSDEVGEPDDLGETQWE